MVRPTNADCVPARHHSPDGQAGDAADLSQGFATIDKSQRCVLYHFVIDRMAPSTVSLPSDVAQVNASQRAYWECSSPMLLRDQLVAANKPVNRGSRGLVFNGELRDLIQPIKSRALDDCK